MSTEKLTAIGARPSPSPAEPPSKMTLVTFLLLLVISLAVTGRMLFPYVLAVAMGGILAFISYPFFQKLKFRHSKPKIAATLVTLGITLLIVAPVTILAILAIKQGIAIGQNLSSNETFSFQSVLDRLSRWNLVEQILGNPEAIERQVRGWLRGATSTITATILGVAANIPRIILQLVLACLSCFFFLIDGPKFLSWMTDKIPLDSDVRVKVISSFKNTAIAVILASLVTATVQSLLMLLAYLALSVPAPFLAMGATFVFAWIPILGSAPVWIIGAIYLYAQGAILKAGVIIIFGLIIGIVDNFVRPIILKGRGNMHPLVSLVAVFGGIGMFGISGIFVGPILVAIMISLLQIWPSVGQRFGVLGKPRAEERKADLSRPA